MLNQQLQTTEGTLALFNTNKQEREFFARDIINRIKEGQAEAHKVHLYLKCMGDIVKRVTENEEYRELVVEEISKHGKGGLQTHNGSFSIKEAGVVYHYENCGDPVIADLQEELAALKAKVKAREEFLKAIPSCGQEILVGDELVKVFPPYKTSTTVPEVKLS